MSKKNNSGYTPKHLHGKRKASKPNRAPREHTRNYTEQEIEERVTNATFGSSFDYQAFRDNLRKRATEIAETRQEPEKENSEVSGQNVPEMDSPSVTVDSSDAVISEEPIGSVVSDKYAEQMIDGEETSSEVPETNEPEPEIIDNASEPESVDDAVEPEIIDNASEPESADDAVEPEIVDNVSEPESVDDAVEPESVDNISEPESADDAVEPESVDNVSEPESADDAVEPEIIDNASESESADDTTEPESVDDAAAESASSENEEESIDFVTLSEVSREEEPVVKTNVSMGVVELEEDEIDKSDTSDSDSDQLQNSSGKKRPKKKIAKKVIIAVVSVILVLIIGLVGTFFVLREIGRRSINSNNGLEITLPTEDKDGNRVTAIDKYGRIIKYNGVSYTYNDDIVALTLIGVDNGVGSEENLQMADAVYILAIDSKTGETNILGVSRDTMCEVNVYVDGELVKTEKQQLAYSYVYHSSTKTCGDNTNKSLSRLFFGLPCKNYFALDLEALVDLNDAIGGVTLTSSITFVSPEDGRTINEGETVTLHGKEAEYYVRRRDITQLESNNDRMQRQQEYIKAFLGSVFSAAKKDISVVSDLYNVVKDNSDSTLSLAELTYLASLAVTKLDSAQEIEYSSLKGKIVKGNPYAEMYVPDDEVLSKMLDIFYKPVEEEE